MCMDRHKLLPVSCNHAFQIIFEKRFCNFIQTCRDRCNKFYQQYPKITMTLAGILILYGINKIYQTRKYNQKLFTKPEDIANKVILITGCGSGFGKSLALKLSIEYGYRVIATCRRQESVDEYLSNSSYTSNGSTACTMDVTNSEHISRVKEFTIKYLSDTNQYYGES